MDGHGIASAEEWVVARMVLVSELTRLRDRFSAGALDLPWAAFGAPDDLEALAGLFDGSGRGFALTDLLDKLERYLGMKLDIARLQPAYDQG
jgi:predicted dithiol-disulfide oxidoreductase (DUF899 family)